MQLAFSTLVGIEPVPFSEIVAWSAAHGIRHLEVNVGPGYPFIDNAPFPGHLELAALSRGATGEISALLLAHDVEIVSLAPMLNLLTLDPELRQTRIGVIQETIDAAVALGVSTVVTFAGSAYGMHFQGLPGVGLDHPSNRSKENIGHFADVYGPLAEYADHRGVRIAFETAGRGGGEGNVAHSPALWDAMFDAVPSAAIGLSFDPSHLVWLGIGAVEAVIRRYANRIYHVDAKDCEILPEMLAQQGIWGANWWRYRLPGSGTLDWKMIVSTLAELGYRGPLSIENEDPEMPGLAGVDQAGSFLRPIVKSFDTLGEVR